MTIAEMHINFRQYAQQMGMQNVRAILPEQIDILLNTSIMDTVNQLIRENIGITNDRVVTDNSKIGQINAFRTLYDVKEVSISIGTNFTYSSSDRLIKGEIVSDNFIEGYVAFFNSETGLLSSFNYCKFGSDGTVINLKQEKDLVEEIGNVDKIKNEMILFRNVILEEDYFTDIYERYKQIRGFIKEHMNSIDVLDDKEKFPEIIKLCVGYNSLNLYAEIEKKVYNKKV